MYWSSWGEQRPQIERAAMDGDAATREVIVDDVTWPTGLTIDHAEQRVSAGEIRHRFIIVMLISLTACCNVMSVQCLQMYSERH